MHVLEQWPALGHPGCVLSSCVVPPSHPWAAAGSLPQQSESQGWRSWKRGCAGALLPRRHPGAVQGCPGKEAECLGAQFGWVQPSEAGSVMSGGWKALPRLSAGAVSELGVCGGAAVPAGQPCSVPLRAEISTLCAYPHLLCSCSSTSSWAATQLQAGSTPRKAELQSAPWPQGCCCH